MVLAILSLGTSKRRCEYSHAIVLPFASTMVDTAGTSPCSSCADPLATTSEARLDIRPMPPAKGNISAAATMLASRQNPESLSRVSAAGGRSDMRTTVAAPLSRLRAARSKKTFCPRWAGVSPGVEPIFALASQVRGKNGDQCGLFPPADWHNSGRSSQKIRYRTVAQLPADHLTYIRSEIQVTPMWTVCRSSQHRLVPEVGGRVSGWEEGISSCREFVLLMEGQT